jgi:peptidoglycan-associated lipoprotein
MFNGGGSMKKKTVSTIIFAVILMAVCMFAGCAGKTKVASGNVSPSVSDNANKDYSTILMDKDINRQLPAEKSGSQYSQSILETVNGSVVFFDFDSSVLNQDAIKKLNTDAAILKTNPGIKIQIEGHCDERGTVEYNLALGQKRADSVMKYFTLMGIDKERISTISYGKERPADPAHNQEAWAKNRRAFIRVVTS